MKKNMRTNNDSRTEGSEMKFPYFTFFTSRAILILFIIIAEMFCLTRHSPSQNYEKKMGVFINPRNKQKTVGYVKIADAWGEQLRPPADLRRGIINLKEAMNKYTKIETELDDHLLLSSPNLLNMPFVYVTTKKAFQLTETERANVKKYFDMGGFMVVENAEPEKGDFSKGGASLKEMLRKTIPNARFAPILNSHQLYHCFFDFDDGPPQGIEVEAFVNPSLKKVNQQRIADGLEPLPEVPLEQKKIIYLEGVWHRGRLAAVYSDKGYIQRWNQSSDNPQLRMGVNMIVFSLTQDGGIAEKY